MNDDIKTIPVSEVARRLITRLGPTLVAALAGSKSADHARAWARVDGTPPDSEAAERLRFAYEQWNRVAAAEGDQVARMWFVGGNPWLEEHTPVTAIREGKYRAVSAAAQALVDDSFSG